MKRLVLALLVAACGGGNSPGGGDAAIDAPAHLDANADAAASPLALTSPVLAPSATFMTANTCDGANASPQLAWTGDAHDAQSFAVTLTDTSISLVHWVIYDIPAASTGLPADVMKVYAPANVAGAHQTDSYQAGMRGYLGPCPPQGGGAHTYQFAVYALDVAALPGASMSTTRAQAVPLIQQHMLATATLTGTYAR